MATFWPSINPLSLRPLRNAVKKGVHSAGEARLRNPTTGIADCCARAASGHAAAALPRSVMNSRRLIGSSPSQGSRIKYSRSWRGFRADHRHSKSGPLVWHDGPSGRGPATPTRGPAWRVCPCTDIATPARTSSYPYHGPAARRADERRPTAASFCAVIADTCAVPARHILPAHPHATNGPIAFYAMTLVNLRESIAEPIEALCCVA
jgi:hypothetical protein